jgi:hypothetical protein
VTNLFSMEYSPWVEAMGWMLLHSLWQGAVVATSLALLMCLFNRASAQIRYVGACAECYFQDAATRFTTSLIDFMSRSFPTILSSGMSPDGSSTPYRCRMTAPPVVADKSISACCSGRRLSVLVRR